MAGVFLFGAVGISNRMGVPQRSIAKAGQVTDA